mmetsp:Transcript_60775/g.144769  ORF Transcript_60775/g.144769 Transcript_60775/m.144769 type:complete len:224 (-) Transcript_60775:1256-1927(-)
MSLKHMAWNARGTCTLRGHSLQRPRYLQTTSSSYCRMRIQKMSLPALLMWSAGRVCSLHGCERIRSCIPPAARQSFALDARLPPSIQSPPARSGSARSLTFIANSAQSARFQRSEQRDATILHVSAGQIGRGRTRLKLAMHWDLPTSCVRGLRMGSSTLPGQHQRVRRRQAGPCSCTPAWKVASEMRSYSCRRKLMSMLEMLLATLLCFMHLGWLRASTIQSW